MTRPVLAAACAAAAIAIAQPPSFARCLLVGLLFGLVYAAGAWRE